MTGGSSESCGPLAPAPYGKACIGCVRAKCKCFYQSDGLGCERCHRLGKHCEPSKNMRKRKARKEPSTKSNLGPPVTGSSNLMDTVDDSGFLLRSQTVEKTGIYPREQNDMHQNGSAGIYSSSSSITSPPGGSVCSMIFRKEDPDLIITLNPSVVQFLRRNDLDAAASTIFNDVTVHSVSAKMADESLAFFKHAFLSTFPFVHIPAAVSSAELLVQKPFLWLVISALTTKNVSQQFAMEETIWNIISRRVIAQQHASPDLLLGVICFASWSHYFKQDKPFMAMLSQVAVALAFELGLHKDVSVGSNSKKGAGSSEELSLSVPKQQIRSMEDRRTFLALFHLTSATWTSYRKTEPLRWTHYLSDCLSILADGGETDLDTLLVMQIKCQAITNSLTCPNLDESPEGESMDGPPPVLMAAMKARLNDIKQSLPPQVRSATTSQFYLHSTETTILECFIGRKPLQNDRTGLSHFRRIQDLQLVLDSVERWLSLFLDMPLIYWTGVSVDTFAQFTHSLVVLFRLTTLEEPGWDRDEVRKRVDVYSVLDRACDTIDQIPREMGMVNASGSRSGLFFKTNYLFLAIKQLFLRQATKPKVEKDVQIVPIADQDVEAVRQAPECASTTADDISMDLSNEPWLADLLDTDLTWNVGTGNLPWSQYSEY